MRPIDPHNLMWAEACELLEQAERLHRQFFQLGRCHGSGPVWNPPVDVFEDDQHFVILVALPGVVHNRVEVTIDAPYLIITGERSVPMNSGSGIVHRLEIPYGRFERRIELPQRPMEIAMRELVDGCLRLQLRKLG